MIVYNFCDRALGLQYVPSLLIMMSIGNERPHKKSGYTEMTMRKPILATKRKKVHMEEHSGAKHVNQLFGSSFSAQIAEMRSRD